MSNETPSSLLTLNPMVLPDPPGWLPFAWGWWAIIAAVLFTVIFVYSIYRWNKKRLAPKKAILRLLANDNKPSEAIELVRQAALCYFPREHIARLTGKEWYEFLDSQITSPCFVGNYERWQRVLYTKDQDANVEELVSHCSDWVTQALPPKRRRAKRG